MYQPEPINTDDVLLPPELEELTELLAKNAHEVWAAGRVKEGWTWGVARDDETRTTPCLVPYEQLPEEEKAYDRNTALQTLKLVCRLGYRITKEV